MAALSNKFVSQVAGDVLVVPGGMKFMYSLRGTFTGSIVLEASLDQGVTYNQVEGYAFTAAAPTVQTLTNEFKNHAYAYYRFRAATLTSGSAVGTLAAGDMGQSKARTINSGAKAGQPDNSMGTDDNEEGIVLGWQVNAPDDGGMLATLASGLQGDTLIVPVADLYVGDVVNGFYLIGLASSVGATLTIDCDLRQLTVTTAGIVDVSVGTMPTLIATTTAVLGPVTTQANVLQMVADGETYYLRIKATTGNLCSISLQAVGINITRA